MGLVLGKCRESFESRLQWEHWESRDGPGRLEQVTSYDVQFILNFFLSQPCIPLIQTDFNNRLNYYKCT